MLKKALFALPFLLFAFTVLLISIFKVASVQYNFNGPTISGASQDYKDVQIDYELAYPGSVLPDSYLWPLKVFRDRLWLFATTNDSRKAELYLLFADKRIGSALILFQEDKPEVGYASIQKAERYLILAKSQEDVNRNNNIDTKDFLLRLANASLKHYQVLLEIQNLAPEDAKPKIVEVLSYPKKVYEDSRNALLEERGTVPQNPFEWQ